jgi:hypothetical protein
LTAPDVKQLYKECGRRIVAVENKHSSQDEKNQYASEVADAVLKKGGYYAHSYFNLLTEKKIQAEETARLRSEIERVAKEQKRSFCPIL